MSRRRGSQARKVAASTANTPMFQNFCMSKQKDQDPHGGVPRRRPPGDQSMSFVQKP